MLILQMLKRMNLATLVLASTSLLRADGLIAHFAAGGQWGTKFIVVNASRFSETATVWFWDDAGNSLSLPVVGIGPTPGVQFSLPPMGVGSFETDNVPSGTVFQGYATVVGRSVSGSAIFRQRIDGYPDFESAVPVSLGVQRVVLPFDNTTGYFTGIALVNTDRQNVLVRLIIRDASGTIVTNSFATRLTHQAFLLKDSFPETANMVGTVEFDAYTATDSGSVPASAITAILLRFNPTGPFTTLTAAYAGNY
jgi:hypothetical protein